MMDPMALPPPGHLLPAQHPAPSLDPAIDPSLAIDPAILGESSTNDQAAPAPRPPSPGAAPRAQFAQGPQGDPFAPPPRAAFFARPPSPPRPLKRKRRARPAARRDDECSFCRGDDARNKAGHAEQMVSCVACGRSGHPSCLGIAGIADVLHAYAWHCIECKICEVCEKKGNGNRMLFCDACDRGWHMDCLQPPLEDTPNGSWVCPLCPLVPLPPPEEGGPSTPQPPHVSASPAPSAASPSQPQQDEPKSRLRNAGRNNRKARPQSETEEEERPRVRLKNDPDARLLIKMRGKGKGKGKIKAQTAVKGKGRARAAGESHTLKFPKLRASRRGRSNDDSTSPDPPILATRKVRLVVKKPKVVVDEEEEENEDDEDDDAPPAHMFEGILTPAQYNTTNTAIHDSDRSLFNRSRTRAELKLGPPVAPIFPSALFTPGPATPVPSTPAGPSSGPGLLHSLRSTRHSVAQALHFQNALETPPGTPQPGAAPNNLATTPLPPRIRTIRFGEYDIDTWYDAPFPEEYASVSDGKLWMCEFCLKYMKSRFQSTRHRMKCKARHPPGDEIYRDGTISVFEVDGRKNKIYCQNLCLLSKMFLDHKSLFYDVEPFLFYVMTEVDRLGARFVGYFSKEKRSPKDYNVSCIMTLPVRQRRGWGNILIDFSYLLSKKENRVGSPERPLSTLGSLAYKQYWTHTVKIFLHTATEPVTLQDISRGTGMTLEDIYNTLREQKMITSKEVTPPPPPRPPPGTPIKYLRGRKHGPGITRRGLARTNTKEDTKAPLVIPTEYTIHRDLAALDAYVATWLAKEHITIKPRCLKWSPFLLTRERKTQTKEPEKTEQAPATETIGAIAMDLDRSSASSTQVPQVPLDVAVSTPKHPDESALLELATIAEMQSPSLTLEVEDSKLRVPRSPSHDTKHAAEDLVTAVELAQNSMPRVLRTRSKSLRAVSADRTRASPTAESLPKRVLRPRTTGNNVKRARKKEEEEEENDTSNEASEDILRDGALAAKLAKEGSAQPRRTRSSYYKKDPPKPAAPRTSPRKRRRIESSTEPEPEPDPEYDDENSLSELTRTSRSPSPSPLPRRVTRSLNGKVPNSTPRENGTISNASTRSTRSDTHSLAPVRSSPRINGAIHLPVVKRPTILGEILVGRTRSTRRNKASSIPDVPEIGSKDSTKDHPEDKVTVYERNEEEEDAEEDGEGETEEEEAETDENAAAERHSLIAEEAPCVNGTGPDNKLGQSGTPALYDEDALGEEDAEGEEDPNPDSDIES